MPSRAGVTVVQNVSPGATNWPGTPIISTMANPSSSAPVPQSFTNAGRTRLAQTFTVTATNYTLQQFSIYSGGGTGTDASTNLNLRLYDLGFQNAPQPAPYGGVTPNETISANLFGSGAGLSISYTNQSNGILQFDFTGSDQVLLQLGHMYVFEIGGTAGQQPMYWLSRTSSSTYSGGAAYTNRYWLNGSSTTEFPMAIYGTASTNLPAPAPLTAVCSVNWTNVRQRIDGFGASSAFRQVTGFSEAQADMFFSTNTGVGLSLLRSQIQPGGSAFSAEISIMKQAQIRGARVWSAPWTPPNAFKDSGTANGGNYRGGTATNQAYAKQLASYVVTMGNQIPPINVYAISVQNEPDVNTTGYPSCVWTAQQIHDFIPYLSAELAASNVSTTKIILPESQHWSSNPSLYATTMNDATVASNVSIIADHNYDGINVDNTATSTPTQINSAHPSTALWETEVSALKGSYSSIYNGVYWAGRIHAFMTVAQANAWHHWWLISGNTTPNQGLLDSAGNPTKRMYVMGNFSRFVRPDFYRIGVITNSGAAVVSAYKDPNSGKFSIVAINNNTTNSNSLTVNLTNLTTNVVSSVTPWVTSRSLSLASQSAIVVSNAAFTYVLPGPSVVTFVGQVVSNSPPTLTPVGNQTINAGVTLMVTNVATDPNAPPQVLTFSLLSAPTNATLAAINATNALFTWRPLVSQADTTNLITVQVADNGAPSLRATNNFTVTVNPLAQPVVSSIAASEGQVSLLVDGAPGPDYTLLTSTNLIDWQALFTTNSPAVPFTLVDTNFNVDPARFYRIQLGP